jgi:hypothetical protein
MKIRIGRVESLFNMTVSPFMTNNYFPAANRPVMH